MFIKRLTRMSLAFAVLGIGMLAGCGGDNGSTASTSSETSSGTPIADVDTSLVRKKVVDGDPCSDLLDEAHVLAKKTYASGLGRSMCGAYVDIYMYMNARVRVVDAAGNPVVGADVYEGRCAYGDEGCHYTTDRDGYIYLDSVNYLTYLEKYEGALEELGSNKAYESRYEELQLRVISADSSLGANVFSYFARARVVMIDEEPVAELQKIVVEPVYSAKLYLDSIYLPEEDEWYHDRLDETIAEAGFGICVQVEDGILSRHYERDGLPYDFYPCQMVTEEDKKNGFVYVYGLPEGNYEFAIGSPNSQFGMGSFSFEVTRPAE
jgi:hypothetical protein